MINATRTIEREEERYGGFNMPVVPDAANAKGMDYVINRTSIAPEVEKNNDFVINKQINIKEKRISVDEIADVIQKNDEIEFQDEVYYDRREKTLPWKIKALLFGYLFFVLAIVVGVIAIGSAATAFETKKASDFTESKQVYVNENPVEYVDFAEYKF